LRRSQLTSEEGRWWYKRLERNGTGSAVTGKRGGTCCGCRGAVAGLRSRLSHLDRYGSRPDRALVADGHKDTIEARGECPQRRLGLDVQARRGAGAADSYRSDAKGHGHGYERKQFSHVSSDLTPNGTDPKRGSSGFPPEQSSFLID